VFGKAGSGSVAPLEYVDNLSNKEKSKALTSLIFLREKRDGMRSCANGSVKREHVAKEEAVAPTVSL